MHRKTDEKTTYDYNIYKISVDKAEDFKHFLGERSFDEIDLKKDLIKETNGFNFNLMFCDKDNRKGSPWVKLLSSCSEEDLTQDLKIYGAALICTGKESCYVVSYGNAHFYLSNYCDYNFGIKIAERLINLDSVKAQQNVSHGGKLNKTHIDYLSGATLSYKGGEIPTYIKGNSVNEEVWGKSINCGTSAQFKWEETPLQIGKKLKLIDDALNTESTISLPRLIPLNEDSEADKIESLFQKLAQAIDEYDENTNSDQIVNVPSFYMVGTKLIQNDSVKFRLSCRKYKEYDGELSVAAIKEFVQEKDLDIYRDIKNIKLSVEYANGQWTNSKPLIEYIEFVTEDNFCLRNGRWCSFNNAYMELVIRDVSKVDFLNHVGDEWNFNGNDLIEFAKEKGIYVDADKQPYETYYNTKLAEILNAKIVHPNTIPVDENANKRYKYEVCDLVYRDSMYFVKIGQPSDFAYAVDQAMFTLSEIQNGYGKVKLPDGTLSEPKEFHLVLICENRKTIVSKWNDIYSVNFLIHMVSLKQDLNIMNISLKVHFVYNTSVLKPIQSDS